MKTVAVIIARNEKGPIKKTLEILNGFVYKGLLSEVIVVNDASTDSTAKIAKAFGARVVSHRTQLGQRIGFITGAKAASKARADVMVWLDADILKFPKRTLTNMVRAVSSGKYDMAAARQFECVHGRNMFSAAQNVPSALANGQRAFRMKALEPLLRRNKKWVSALTALTPKDPRMRNLEKQPAVRELFAHLDQEIEHMQSLSRRAERTEQAQRWGLPQALERLFHPSKRVRLRSKIWTMKPFRIGGFTTMAAQKGGDIMVRDYFASRRERAKALRKQRAAFRRKGAKALREQRTSGKRIRRRKRK